MGRIRTIKPELFKHEVLFDMEAEDGVCYRLIYAGLWTLCDREGRFKWRPRTLKADAFPFDSFDMARVLDALLTRGFLAKYEVDGEVFGRVPSWKEHQFINNKEPNSTIPEPQQNVRLDASITCDPRVLDACDSRSVKEGKVMEGKGMEDASATRSASPSDFDHHQIAHAVMDDLRLSGDRLHITLADVAKQELARGEPPEVVRSAMAGAWRDYDGASAKLAFHMKPATFFGDGRWRNRDAWGWKDGAKPVLAGTRKYLQLRPTDAKPN